MGGDKVYKLVLSVHRKIEILTKQGGASGDCHTCSLWGKWSLMEELSPVTLPGYKRGCRRFTLLAVNSHNPVQSLEQLLDSTLTTHTMLG